MLIRDLREDELAFLHDMLYAALAWRPDRWLPPKSLLVRIPQVSMFHKGWGVQATRPSSRKTAAPSALRGTGSSRRASHGEGFVEERTPEVAIAVVEGHCGSGVGTALMEAIHTHARAQGLTQISLSVDADNPAKRLYERLGYVDYPPGHEHGRMLIELT
jgi:GNAT superfamily N-acetyltransferase